MTARNSMIHRCNVERDGSLGLHEDPWGGDDVPEWTTHLTDLSCRFWWQEAVGITGSTIKDSEKLIEMTRRILIVPEGTDIHEDDRVVSVRDRRDRELADGPMRIDAVGRRDGHLVCRLVDVR